MAYDPQMLRSIAANPAAYPGSPPSPVDRSGPPAPGTAGDEKPKSEPEQLAELGAKAKESLAAARAAFEELSATAEMAETIDPKTERTIAKAAETLASLDEDCEAVCETLEAAAGEHTELVDGDD